MKRFLSFAVIGLLCTVLWRGDAAGRGFGGFRGGGFSASRSFSSFGGGFSASSSRSFSSYGGASFSGSRSASGYSGWDRGGASSSYERSASGSHGGSISTEGTRGVAYGPRGVAAGGTRETTATGPQGRTYSGSTSRGAAVGANGRMVGGSEHVGMASGPRGTVAGGWQSAFAGGKSFAGDGGLAHYSSFGAVGAHSTSYWSHSYTTARAGTVRTGFGYYGAFHPAWYTAHPGAWHAASWTAAAAAWRPVAWTTVASFCGMAATGGIYEEPPDYDYGNNVVYQGDDVYQNGQEVATADQFAQQATALADKGQKADAPADAEWKALGVFALVQGDEKTSNNVFQIAVNKDGVIRGNYYDGLMDTTTPIFGSVDKKTQRAAWTIGKKNDRVFEAGVYNLTKSETPVLVHIGSDRTQQMLLVRMEQPKNSK